jgi:hypothetical protein
MKECPKCELVNPDDAKLCDCGYDFRGGSLHSRSRIRRLAREILKGVFGVAAVVWILAPIRGLGLAVFAVSTVVILICALLVTLLAD